MHVHLSAIDAITTFLYVVIMGFLWRTLAGLAADTPIGKAMAFIF